MELANRRGHKISMVYADRAYGSVENWSVMSREYHCRFVTSFRSDTAPNNYGCPARGDAARCGCSLPYDEWVRVTGYGIRWKIEGTFSDLKWVVSEVFRPWTDLGHVGQSYAKIVYFNVHKAIRAEMVDVTKNDVVVAA